MTSITAITNCNSSFFYCCHTGLLCYLKELVSGANVESDFIQILMLIMFGKAFFLLDIFPRLSVRMYPDRIVRNSS